MRTGRLNHSFRKQPTLVRLGRSHNVVHARALGFALGGDDDALVRRLGGDRPSRSNGEGGGEAKVDANTDAARARASAAAVGAARRNEDSRSGRHKLKHVVARASFLVAMDEAKTAVSDAAVRAETSYVTACTNDDRAAATAAKEAAEAEAARAVDGRAARCAPPPRLATLELEGASLSAAAMRALERGLLAQVGYRFDQGG